MSLELVSYYSKERVVRNFPFDYTEDLKLGLLNLYLSVAKNMPGFPNSSCFKVSNRIKELGLTPEWGWFQVDIPLYIERSYNQGHNWNKDNKARIVDFTAEQFTTELCEPIPSGIIIIDPEHPLYHRYIQRHGRI